jgi:TolB-like protein/DNA-binding winged helix-turn-helix (wHTH) protein
MPDDLRTTVEFAGFTLDCARGRLFRGSDDVALRPKTYALLAYLVRNAGRVVSKDDLLTAIWPDATVTEDSLTQCVHEVRRVLGPHGASLLRTMPRRGYLFDLPPSGPVALPADARPPTLGDLPPAQDPDKAPVPPLRRDGIAVMPFLLASTAQDDLHLFDGLVHDVIGRLARLQGFRVIARGSTFALRHLAADPAAAGRALNVAYVVGGSARVQGDRITLSFDLIQVEDSTVLWSQDLTDTRDNFLAFLDMVTEQIVQTVQMRATAAEIRRVLGIPHEDLGAWESFHAGLHDAFTFDRDRVGRALDCFRHASRLAPGFARAHAAESFCHYFMAFSGMSDDRPAAIAAARRTAERALDADDSNPSSLWAYSRALWLDNDPDGCLQYAHRAAANSPSFAHAQYMIGFVETHAGSAQRGLQHIDRMLSLSPFDPFLASAQITRAFALVRLGQLDEAANWALDAARQPNAYAMLLAPASLIVASAGRTEEARQMVARVRGMAPDFRIEQVYRSLHSMSEDVADVLNRNVRALGL